MDVEDEPLLFQTNWGEEEDGGMHAAGRSCLSWEAEVCRLWRVLAWVHTHPCASGVVLGVVILLLCCPPQDIDLSYSAFEVHSHFSAERCDALAIAGETQLSSWDRHRRDLDTSEAEGVQELLLEALGRKGVLNRTNNEGTSLSASHSEPLHVEIKGQSLIWVGGKYLRPKEGSWDGNSTLSLTRKLRFAHNYYLQSQAMWRIELLFVVQGEGDRNIFTPERLQTIHQVEHLLMQQPRFHQFCWKPQKILRDLPLGLLYCSPPSLLLSYLYASERGGKMYYDGMGPDLADIQGSLHLAITHPQFYCYVDESPSPKHLSSSLLRSETHFGAPLPSYYSLQERMDERRSVFKNFVVQYADILAKQSTGQVKVLYGENELFDNEVRHTFNNGMMLAVIILTSFSVFLTFFGLTSIGLSCLMALFSYYAVFGVRCLGILSGVAAFVIIGIGKGKHNNIFIQEYTFRQASHLQKWMIYTIKTAGRATFLTSFYTAAAYAANTFSHLILEEKSVHDFGLFIALIVSCCWLWVSVLMPAALCVWTDCVEPQGHAWQSRRGVASFLFCKLFSGLPASHGPLLDEDDDVALLSVEMEPVILSLSVETPASPPGQRHVDVVSKNLQWALKHLVAEPAVACLFTGSPLICWVLLSPEAGHSRTPSFPPGHNLQTLLDLRSNLSGQGISCPTCSGVFMEKPHRPYTHMSSSAFKFSTHPQAPISLLTVYISKLELGASATLYRFSLNTSTPSPWKPCSTSRGVIISGQSATKKTFFFLTITIMTVCVSHEYHPYPSWMITSTLCDRRHAPFSFHLRRLHVCVNPPDLLCSSPQCKGFKLNPSSATKTIPSKTFGFNRCSSGASGQPAVRPLVDTGAMVFLDNRVIKDLVITPSYFDVFQEMEHLCKMCKAIRANRQLVKPGGCGLSALLSPRLTCYLLTSLCKTTYKGKSSFQTYSDFLQRENFFQKQLASHPQSSGLQRGFQTCEHWKQILMEIIGNVENALWSLLLSLAICVYCTSSAAATRMICVVEMGPVEAISLSILVGSSVDYSLHLVEGYILVRGCKLLQKCPHYAVTTAISTVPFFFCVIVPFAKFGQIVAINTAVSILFTLTLTVATLACVAPARFSRPPGAVLKAALAVMTAAALRVAVCWMRGLPGALTWQSFNT
uniref:DUF7023 domain-containing protein n=1 Tax=Mola mola TaxID=94237 RepID=A0A3Q3VNU6_MOLML